MKAKARERWQTPIWTVSVLVLVGAAEVALADGGTMGGIPSVEVIEKPILAPELIVTDAVLSDETYGDGDGVIEDGEIIEVSFTLTNIGEGRSRNGTLSAEWAAGVGEGFRWNIDEASMGAIFPGHSGQAGPLRFLVNTEEPLAIGVYELRYAERLFSQSVDELAVAANPLEPIRLGGGGVHTGLARLNDRYLVWRNRYLELWAKDMEDGSEWMVDDLNPETLTLHGNWVAYAGGPWDAVWLRMANLETGEIIDVAQGEWWLVDKEIEPALNDRYLAFAANEDNVLFPPEIIEPPRDGALPLRVLDLETLTHRRVTLGSGTDEESSPALDGDLLAFSIRTRLYLTNLNDPPGSEVELHDTGHWTRWIHDVELGEGFVFFVTEDYLYRQELATGEETVDLLFGGLDITRWIRIDVGDGWLALSNWDVLRLLRLDDGALVKLQRHSWFDPAALDGRNLVYTTRHVSGWPVEIRKEILPSGDVHQTATLGVSQGVVVEVDPTVDVTPGPRASIALHGSYPNPFHGATTITFDVPHTSAVDLRIYDTAGRLVRTLVSDRLESGPRQVYWDGRDSAGRPAAAGVYFYRLEAAEVWETRKLVRLK